MNSVIDLHSNIEDNDNKTFLGTTEGYKTMLPELYTKLTVNITLCFTFTQITYTDSLMFVHDSFSENNSFATK